METGSALRRVKLGSLIAVPVTAALLAFAAVAFACVPQAGIRLSTTTGPVGTTITVTASNTNFAEGAAVSVYWGGLSGQLVGTSTGLPGGTIAPVSFKVPAEAVNGYTIVTAKQVKDGASIGNPASALFNVNTPGQTAPVPASNLQDEPRTADGAAGLAPVDAAQPAATASPAPAPAAAPAPAPRVRTAPAQSTTAARTPVRAVAPAPAAAAPAAAPAPAVEATPAPVAAPAPAVTPTPEPAPATSPARRSVMVSMASDDGGSPALAIALVAIGLVLALGASAVALAGRRDRTAPAKANR